MSQDTVDRWLDRVVSGLPAGEERLGQRSMANAVAHAIRQGRHLAVRAGTGTGKSLAYLVAAVLSGKKVLIATATKALEDQLASKDLPSLQRLLGQTISFAVLKGRSNYLCVQRLVESETNGSQQELVASTSGVNPLGEQARKIAVWGRTTTSGDVAELEFEPEPSVWSSFSVTADECPGAARCPSGDRCFAEAARAAAADADLVVVNLHLLGAHLRSEEGVLPEFEVLVVDEAHELEEVMSRSLGSSISASKLRSLASAARTAVPASTDVRAAADGVVTSAAGLEAVLEGRGRRRIGPGTDPDLDEALLLAATRLERLSAALLARSVGEAPRAASTERVLVSAGRLRAEILAALEPDDDAVVWVESGARPSLEVAPIDVAATFGPRAFPNRSIVFTSATLPPGLAVRVGADPADVDELDVGSPFAFQDRALLYCAAHLPDPRRENAEASVRAELARLIAWAGGRTLGLFTSRRAMEAAASELRATIGVPLLVQGEASKAELVEQFRTDQSSCLFATMGFWQGVDVPGATCSVVAIDKIPFSRPDEPLLQARRERAGPDAFRAVDLPRAASLLAQGAGRLIRCAEDRGVVAVLDPRLATASYRWDLVRALPPMRRTKDPADVESFLAQIRSDAPC